MQYFPPALEALVEQFAKLPGIGRKSAQRLAFFLLSLPEEDAAAFADAIVNAKRDWSDKPRMAQRMAKVTVDTFGVDYPAPEQY